MNPDLCNGLFELVGGLMIWVSIFRTWSDREAKGFSPLTNLFFTAWGYWNLYFYSHLDQWYSLLGAAFMVLSNTTWLGSLGWLYFNRWTARRREEADRRSDRRCRLWNDWQY